MIALLDYKAGNLTSVRKALAAVGADVLTPDTPEDLARASAVIMPGVGHFGATSALDRRWIDAILDGVSRAKPLLGICLGLHFLFEGSEEAPEVPGLGLLSGRCVRLRPPEDAGLKVPHVGWNSLDIIRRDTIVDGIETDTQVYFTHSYVAPLTPDTVAATTHGERFAAVVQRGHVSGAQFHPEKSGEAGLQVLRNFLSQVR
ncbi:MAG: imidazole glycerol phosphate synthase subunit HisH [Acidobacteriaceae bacterium]|nr:imidazole glycerol phosphate synthase subunit HisH [Acidobacteriaceae bacterium]